MPRAFTEDEKATIRERLLKAGRDCFLRFGLKKTTIEDLTKPAGIAKASFYLFFDSKEQLFVEIFVREMPEMMERLLDASFRATSDTREALVRLMKAIVIEIQTNEMSRILLDDPAQLETLAAGLDYQGILAKTADLFAPLLAEVAKAQERGEIIPGSPLQLMYSLGLIKLLPVNRDRIPQDMYDSLFELAPQIIADGLTCPATRRRS
jgi:AcrR family transcriptional regulator